RASPALSSPSFPYTTLFRSQLVRLDVGAEREAVLVAVALEARDVPLDRVEIDRRDRRVELRDLHLSRRARRRRRPRRRSRRDPTDRKSTRLNSSHEWTSYAV